MTKSDLIAAVAKKMNMGHSHAETIVKAVFEELSAGLARDHEVSIHAFGSFVVKKTSARTGRNPRTGEPIQIPAGRCVKFSPSKTLKDAVK